MPSSANAQHVVRLMASSEALQLGTITLPHLAAHRLFHSSATLGKKKKNSQAPTYNSPNVVSQSSEVADDVRDSKHPKPDSSNPLNLADINSRLVSLATHYGKQINKVYQGDSFSQDAIGTLTIQPDRKDPTTYSLRELAEIVPRHGGRTVSLLLHDKDYVKPVMAAVQASPEFNQQPQRDLDNELELILKVEATNKDVTLRRAKATIQAWRDDLRAVSEKRRKLHAKWKKEGVVVPDLKWRADMDLQKLQDEQMAHIDKVEQSVTRKNR